MIRTKVQNYLTQVIFTLKDTLLHVSIRLGKTKIALDAIEPGDKVLWLYPLNSMTSGYQEDLVKFPPKSMDITFMNINSVKKIKGTDWDYIVIDEPQLCTSVAQIAALKTITYRKRVGLSGTMNEKTLKKLERDLNWKVGAKYTLENGIADGIVKDYKVYIHFSKLCEVGNDIAIKKFGKLKMVSEREAYDSYCSTMDYFGNLQLQAQQEADMLIGPEKTAKLKSAYFAKMGYTKYMSLRTNLLYNSTCLFNAAESIINQYRDVKCLIYALRTDVVDELSTKTFHSKNKDDEALEWFRTSTDGHLAAAECITTGITIKNLNTTIFHSYNSNTESFHQKLGRSLLYEQTGECANVHVCALLNTQNEVWIESACSSLELDKIYYVIDGVVDLKLNWIKKQHPDKILYQVISSNKIVYYKGVDNEGRAQYSFLTHPDSEYSFKQQNLKEL